MSKIWSYNGTKLPALPAYDEVLFPHAIISYDELLGTVYRLNVIDGIYSCVLDGGLNIENEVVMSSWVLAKDETSVSKNSEYYPGISTTEWLQITDSQSYTGVSYTGATVIWTNVTITCDDGTVFMVGSKPDKGELKSWLTGLVIRLAWNPKFPTPVYTHCWYGNVKLLKLPEWDTEAYPHAYLIGGELAGDQVYILCVTAQRWVRTSEGVSAGDHLRYVYVDGWGNPVEADAQTVDETKIIWCNTDILNEDGTVWMVATEPVPVVNTPEPTAYLYNGENGGET